MAKRAKRLLVVLLGIAVSVVGVFGVEVLLALLGRKEPPFTGPSHDAITLGDSGSKITYVVIGDSTGAGQGSVYDSGIAMGTARHLAAKHRVTMFNYSISGATIDDVVRKEVADAASHKPDLVLLSAGANDATHFTPSAKIKSGLETIVARIRASMPDAVIIVTGCPQMGSVPRFLQPLRWFAGTQTRRVNEVFRSVVAEKHLYWSHIADVTGPIFEQDPSLFAEDQFHPNARGYAIWITVLDQTIDQVFK